MAVHFGVLRLYEFHGIVNDLSSSQEEEFTSDSDSIKIDTIPDQPYQSNMFSLEIL